jgi:signal transduction histidine kinase
MTRRRLVPPILLLAGLLCAARALVVPPATLKPAELRAAALDSLGLLWIGAREGLYGWDGRHLSLLDARDGWEGGGAQALAVDAQGRLWVAADSGLIRRDETFQRVELASPVALGRGRALLAAEGVVWLATERGLLRWQEGQGERVLLSGIAATCLARLPGGELVCGTADHGLYRFDAQGNPAAMNESLQRVLDEVFSIVGLPDGDLLLLGRSAKREERLARLDLRRGELLPLPVQVPKGSPLRLAAASGQVLLQAGPSWWRWADGALRPMSLPAPSLPLPLPELAGLLPQLCWLGAEGRLMLQNRATGMLVPQGEGMALAWESPAQPGGWRPLQTCQAAGSQWLLLGSEKGRRLLSLGPAGTRDFALSWLPPAEARDFHPATICPEPGGGALLIGLADHILRFDGRAAAPLPGSRGASWMTPFTAGAVLVAGPEGLALLEDGELSRLRVAEPVQLAVPDGVHGILAACDGHLLRLNELNELDTLAYPDSLAAAGTPGRRLRQVLADAAGRVWLLGERGLYLRSREGAPWTRPLAGLLGSASGAGGADESGDILSMALDSRGRLWLSTSRGTGWLAPDRLPPVVALLQDQRELEQAQRSLTLRIGAADPLGVGPAPLVRLRLDDQPWGPWRPAGAVALEELLPPEARGGTFRLQVQALDAWGNLSRQTLSLPLVLPEGLGRLPFARRLFLLLAMVAISVVATIFYPGRPGLLFSLAAGLLVGAWLFFNTTEPHLWWALPIILVLSSWQMTGHLRQRAARAAAAPEPGILEVVDLLRDFGHSGSATRNIDRLLRSARNLYLDGRPDQEVNGRFQTARGVYLDLTAPSLEHLLAALRRLPASECPLEPDEQERLADQVKGAARLLESCGDPPGEAPLQELAFTLDRLEQGLAAAQHRVDLRISSSPLRVLDRVLEDRAAELAGVELQMRCEREVRHVLARLPVDKLQFILDNLVDNALHWMREQPAPRLGIDVRERPATLQVRVSDNGAGIAADQRERIFAAGVSGKQRAGKGTEADGGYGLYRSREILARFGGRLVVEESAPGLGSTFLLEIKKVEPEGRQGAWNAS